jgi:pimeloyl-ACP methyl ester carboxylesterase
MTSKPTYSVERIRAEDGVELVGLWAAEPSNSKKALLHIHGLAGNFYEQRFVDAIAAAGSSAGRRPLLLNTRGHDYLSDSYVYGENGRTTLARGGAHERLGEASLDIAAAVGFLRGHGIEDIVITAHSTGAIKAVQYAIEHPRSLAGIVLLSPSDDVGIQLENLKDQFQSTLDLARRRIADGVGEELMPAESFFYPVDAKAYVDLFDPHGPGNVFDMANQGPGLSLLAGVHEPVLVVIGSSDIAVVSDDKAGEVAKILAALPSSGLHQGHVVADAGHDYFEHEDEVEEVLREWLAKLDLR